jgi:hypothetical protein
MHVDSSIVVEFRVHGADPKRSAYVVLSPRSLEPLLLESTLTEGPWQSLWAFHQRPILEPCGPERHTFFGPEWVRDSLGVRDTVPGGPWTTRLIDEPATCAVLGSIAATYLIESDLISALFGPEPPSWHRVIFLFHAAGEGLAVVEVHLALVNKTTGLVGGLLTAERVAFVAVELRTLQVLQAAVVAGN